MTNKNYSESTIKVGTFFSGIGAPEKAFQKLKDEKIIKDYTLEFFSEIDKNAIKSFCAIHNIDESLNLGSITEIKEIYDLLESYGCYTPILNGYGNNEGLGAECVNPYIHNKLGSIGVPLPFNKFTAVDLNTGKELKYGEVGEICVQTETKFVEYTNNEQATKETKKLHEDGQEWIHTGDLGYLDEDGYIHLKGRLRRVIIKAAFKISPDTIEKVICSHPAVKDCVTVGVNDEKDVSVPMAFITLKDEYIMNKQQILEEIKAVCYKGLKDYEIPSYYEIIDTIPYTDNNKQDFRKLETIGNEIVENQNLNNHNKVLKR